jgi:tetratricopeptide (TPR) repeat protein
VFVSFLGSSTSVYCQERSAPAVPAVAAVSSGGPQTPVAEPDGKEPYVVEFLQNKYRFEADGKGYRDLILRVRVKSENAVRDFGVLVYPFASSFETLNMVYVRVRKPDGTVVDTPVSEIQELDSAVSREAPMYTDQREKHVAVKALSVGDLLEANVRWTIHDPIAPGKFWFDHAYLKSGTCLKEILEVDLGRDVPVKIRNSDPQPVIREEGDRRVYRFEASNHQRPEVSKIPDWEKNYHGLPPPDVQFSSFTSWDEVGRWFGGLLVPKLEVTPELRAKSEELTKGKVTEEEKIRAIYDFVSARFRYIGIDLGMGRYAPHTASDVLSNRYGDCKDKHTLFAALLEAAGIPAKAALLSSKFNIDPAFPSPSLFDHVVTAVPRGQEFLFLDTTPEIAPFGLLVAQLRDRPALVVSFPGGSRLASTPRDPPFHNYEKFWIESSVDAKGTLQARMRIEDRGDSELGLRLAYRSTSQDRWQELTQAIIARMGFGGTVGDVSAAQPEDTAHPFWMSFSYKREDFPDWKTHRILLPAPPFFIPELNDQQMLSKEPLPLGSPQDVIYDSIVKFPPGFSPVLPENVDRKTEFAEFSASYSVEKDTLHGTLHLKTLQNEVRGGERSIFNGLAKLVDDTERRYIFIKGSFGDSFAAALLPGAPPATVIPRLEEALAADPNNDTVLLFLSRVYRDNGRAADAVSVLTKAIAAHEDVPPHLYMALGLSYLRVPDAEKAIAEFKKALGDDAEPGDLNEAAYALGDANVDLNDALDYSRRAVSAISSETMDISLEKVDFRDFAVITQLAADWDTLGWIKFRMGDFPAAQRYLAAAWDLMQSSTIGEHLVEVYEKLGQREKAAVICNMASAMRFPNTEARVNDKLSEEMARLRPLLKRKTAAGGMSPYVDGHVALTDLRMFQVPFHGTFPGKSASAEFLISLSNETKSGPPEKVVFLSGAEELRNTSRAISVLKYPQSFPDSEPVRIVRKATLNCNIYSKGCTLILMPSDEAAIALRDRAVMPVVPVMPSPH